MNKEVKERFNKNKENMDFYNQDGTQNQNTVKRKYFIKKPRAQKIKPVSYTYTSEKPEEAFFDVLDNMCNSCRIVNTFMNNALSEYSEEDINSFNTDIYFAIISAHVINTSFPMLIDKKFIHTALSVSANKIYVRTEGNVAFSIELKYQIVEKKAQITGCTGTITLFAKNDKLVEDLEQNGFVKVER